MARRKLRARLDAERTLEAEARALRERDVPVGDVGEAESGAIPSIDSPGRASSVDESWELEESLADSSLADKELLDGLLASLSAGAGSR